MSSDTHRTKIAAVSHYELWSASSKRYCDQMTCYTVGNCTSWHECGFACDWKDYPYLQMSLDTSHKVFLWTSSIFTSTLFWCLLQTKVNHIWTILITSHHFSFHRNYPCIWTSHLILLTLLSTTLSIGTASMWTASMWTSRSKSNNFKTRCMPKEYSCGYWQPQHSQQCRQQHQQYCQHCSHQHQRRYEKHCQHRGTNQIKTCYKPPAYICKD